MSNFILFILLAIIIIYVWIDIRRIFNKLGKLLGVDLGEIRDGVFGVFITSENQQVIGWYNKRVVK